MTTRRISAHIVFPVSSPPVRKGILEISAEGQVLSLTDPGSSFTESRNLEFYNGILVPGLVCPLLLPARADRQMPHAAGTSPPEDSLKWMATCGIVAGGLFQPDPVARDQPEGILRGHYTTFRFDHERKETVAGSPVITPLTTPGIPAILLEPRSKTALIDLTGRPDEDSPGLTILDLTGMDQEDPGETWLVLEKSSLTGRKGKTWLVLPPRLAGSLPVQVRDTHPSFVLFPPVPGSQPGPAMEGFLLPAFRLPNHRNDPSWITGPLWQLEKVFPHPGKGLEAVTRNGAAWMGLDKILGSLERGKRPGLNLVDPFDFSRMEWLPGSRLRHLL